MSFSPYWLLLPLALGLLYWIKYVRDSHTGGFFPRLGMVLAAGASVVVFVVVFCILAALDYWGD
ncbi:hypothetical protein [Hymenobacter lucidus]|uniref:Uncharacterized protein n=1 Tax=Hymenobacter lucidus TaxID=2880930 RepID=A0ABS8AV91_9BACT|nr:hypothetical protein [Hymenobacter lucidus]MCB2410009.1 hypothetical protein [Hymenobacter lucidus]